MTEENKIVELLEKLASLSPKEVAEGKLKTIIKQLLKEEEYTFYLMMSILLEKFRQTGILRLYKKSELQESFFWERTRLRHYLRKALEQNIFLYKKRKYELNLEHILVKRMMEYQFIVNDPESSPIHKLLDTNSLLLQKRMLEEQLLEQKKIKQAFEADKEDRGINQLVEEMQEIMIDEIDPRDSFITLFTRNKTVLID